MNPDEHFKKIGDGEVCPAKRLVSALCFMLVFTVMNATMFNVALPEIASEFQLSHSSVSWIVTGYSVMYALGSVIFGKLADKYPLKRLITIGILLFSGASAIGFFSDSFAFVLTCRLLQAVGASCVPAFSILIPVRFFSQEQRGRVMGAISSTIAFSSGIGPIMGGLIAEHHWNSLFLISLAAPVVLPFIRKSLPHEEIRTGEKVDLLGAGMLGAGVFTFMLSVTQFNMCWLISSTVMLILFVWRARKVPNPFIPLSLFRIKGLRHGLTVSFIAFFAIFGVYLITPIMLKAIHNLNPQWIGYIVFPAAMLAAVMGRFGGGLVDSRGSRFTLYLAFSILGFGLLGLSSFTGLAPWVIAMTLPLVNISFTFIHVALAKAVSSSLPREQIGIGMGIFNLVNFLAGAISGVVLSKASEFDWSALNVTAVGAPSSFGTIFFILVFLIVVNMVWVYLKIEKREATPIMGQKRADV